MEFPNWLNRKLSKADLDEIRAAVANAESKTSAELVPMIVSHSITTGHVLSLLFFIYGVAFWFIAFRLATVVTQVPAWLLEFVAVLLGLLLAWMQRNSRFWWRVLTPLSDRRVSVMRRAQLEFFESDIKATKESTGILIFVSLLERQAVVLADEAIAKQVPGDTWQRVVSALVDRVKAGDFKGGFVEAVTEVGRVLESKFPIQSGDVNELHNDLVIKE